MLDTYFKLYPKPYLRCHRSSIVNSGVWGITSESIIEPIYHATDRQNLSRDSEVLCINYEGILKV